MIDRTIQRCNFRSLCIADDRGFTGTVIRSEKQVTFKLGNGTLDAATIT